MDNSQSILCTNCKSWHDGRKSGHNFLGTCALFKASFFMYWESIKIKKLGKPKELYGWVSFMRV